MGLVIFVYGALVGAAFTLVVLGLAVALTRQGALVAAWASRDRAAQRRRAAVASAEPVAGQSSP